MNLKVLNGEIISDSKGMPVALAGIDDCLQKAQFALTAKRGDFTYERSFGSEIFKIDDLTEDRIVSYANEVLIEMNMKAVSASVEERIIQIKVKTAYGIGNINLNLEEVE